MERVTPVDVGPSGAMKFDASYGKGGLQPYQAVGTVQNILGPGKYLVVMSDGSKFQVQGPNSLRIGDRVQVQSMNSQGKVDPSPEVLETSWPEGGFEWSAIIPLAFGGKGAKATLKVFVEGREKKRNLEKKSQAVYFIFTINTETHGEVQWSIYLKGKQVSIQLYGARNMAQNQSINEIIGAIATALTSKGFTLTEPVTFLKRPFKVPEGFRLNVKG